MKQIVVCLAYDLVALGVQVQKSYSAKIIMVDTLLLCHVKYWA